MPYKFNSFTSFLRRLFARGSTKEALGDSLDIKMTGSDFCIELTNVGELPVVTEAQILYLKELLKSYGVVVIKGKRKWSEAEQKTFTNRLGSLELPIHYSVSQLQSQTVNNEHSIVRERELFWHCDNAYKERPSHLSIFQMVDIPKSGTQTQFGSLFTLYDSLSFEYKSIWRDYEIVYTGGVSHPLLRKHPFNGKQTLYFDMAHTAEILDNCSHREVVTVMNSNEILSYIQENLENQKMLYTHNWESGDIVIIDNYAVAHRAQLVLEDEKCTLLRTTTKGVFF